ncbi:MAG: type secretion system lysozyme-related protein [Gemmatimonadetes bacterium]|jgi:type VI secretion system protein ImpF|nr:type secretion system lysozyme-related protein [Gemmatimonadota bacterium]
MTSREIERTVQPSVLDRLTDLAPRSSDDSRIGYAESLRAFRASVQRDLEWLLNTRRIAEPAPEELEELCSSLYHFGLPDITSVGRESAQERRQMLESVEQAIALFEPRLANVTVRLVEVEGEQHRRELRFVVDATLLMDPTPEQVVFDTVLHFANGEYVVGGARNA